MSTRGLLFREAFEEYKVTRQVSTGNGAMYVSMVEVGGRVPGWFVRDECGHNIGSGHRLKSMPTQKELDKVHRANASKPFVEAPDVIVAPEATPRETKWTRRAKLEQLKARALILRAA